jgi:hypothetical protein
MPKPSQGRLINLAKNKNQNKNADVPKYIKPINVTAIVLALIGGFGPAAGAGAIADALKQDPASNCGVVISRAVDEYKKNPNVRYTGPDEEQCNINEVIDKLP